MAATLTIILVRKGAELTWEYGEYFKIFPLLTAYLTEGIEREVLEVWHFRNTQHMNAEMNAITTRLFWWKTQFQFEAKDANHG